MLKNDGEPRRKQKTLIESGKNGILFLGKLGKFPGKLLYKVNNKHL